MKDYIAAIILGVWRFFVHPEWTDAVLFWECWHWFAVLFAGLALSGAVYLWNRK